MLSQFALLTFNIRYPTRQTVHISIFHVTRYLQWWVCLVVNTSVPCVTAHAVAVLCHQVLPFPVNYHKYHHLQHPILVLLLEILYIHSLVTPDHHHYLVQNTRFKCHVGIIFFIEVTFPVISWFYCMN